MFKKLFLAVLLLIFVGFSLKVFQKASKERLKKETFVKRLSARKFKAMIQARPPKWMEEQIRDDFAPFLSGISKRNVDETFAAIRKNYPHPAIVRYRIINNELYRYYNEGEELSLEDTSYEKALKTLLLFVSFKDMDFILSSLDGIPLFDQPKDFYFTRSKELQAPVLCSAKIKQTPFIILVPDWRSVDSWWAIEIKKVLKASAKTPWEKKKNFAFWRGSLTNLARYKLCQISQSFPKYLDAKINAKLEAKELQMQLEKEGIYGDLSWVEWDKILENKYLPLIDGVMAASPGFQSRLLSNSVTFKQEFEGVQWFFKEIKPFVHYIPIKKDLSDLIDMIKWAEAHDEEFRKIAQASTDFVLDNLMFEDVYLYLYLVLKEYSSLQNLNKKEIKKEMRSSHWVKIQKRANLKKSKS